MHGRAVGACTKSKLILTRHMLRPGSLGEAAQLGCCPSGCMPKKGFTFSKPWQYLTMIERHALLPRAPEPHSGARHGEPLAPKKKGHCVPVLPVDKGRPAMWTAAALASETALTYLASPAEPGTQPAVATTTGSMQVVAPARECLPTAQFAQAAPAAANLPASQTAQSPATLPAPATTDLPTEQGE